MGIKIDQFDIPVCNSFKAKIFNDQLCYEVDPNKYKSSLNIESDLKKGITLLLDYNEDRQASFEIPSELEKMDIYAKFIGTKFEDKVSVHLNTIGGFGCSILHFLFCYCF